MDGWTPDVLGGETGGIVGIGVVIGALLTDELGGGMLTLAPVVLPRLGSGGGGILPDIDELALHSLETES
jgi:hypothetical protein